MTTGIRIPLFNLCRILEKAWEDKLTVEGVHSGVILQSEPQPQFLTS